MYWNYMYQQVYLGLLLKNKIYYKTINVRDVIPSGLLSYMIYNSKVIKWKRYYIIYSNIVVEILYVSLWLKNISIFIKWLRSYFEKINLKKHKKLFLLLSFLLGKLIWDFNIFLQLRGIRAILRGKFGKAGSVRKTRKYIRRGKCSYTSKKIALSSQTTVIRTLTGVFSIKIELFF